MPLVDDTCPDIMVAVECGKWRNEEGEGGRRSVGLCSFLVPCNMRMHVPWCHFLSSLFLFYGENFVAIANVHRKCRCDGFSTAANASSTESFIDTACATAFHSRSVPQLLCRPIFVKKQKREVRLRDMENIADLKKTAF